MAKLEAKPWPGFEHRPGEDWKAYGERIDAALREIQAKHTVVKFPVADGYALYTVVSEKPLVLRHIPYGDAYHAAAATIRGLNLDDVRRQQAAEQVWKNMDDKSDAFFKSLRPGQVVHYHHGFNEYVRCEVVEREGRKELLPLALVGSWRPYDLPRRMPDGSVRWGYHAEKIRERKTFRPHASNVFEYPEYHRRGATDPGGMPALDLSVPELGAEEAERARLWRKVDAVRAALNVPMDADPAEVLEQVRSLLAA